MGEEGKEELSSILSARLISLYLCNIAEPFLFISPFHFNCNMLSYTDLFLFYSFTPPQRQVAMVSHLMTTNKDNEEGAAN